MAVGIAVAYVLSRIDYHIFKDRKVLFTIMGVTVVLLVDGSFRPGSPSGRGAYPLPGFSPAIGIGKGGHRRLSVRYGFIQNGNHSMTSTWD